MNNSGIVNIHGKEYKTVALRVSEFREAHPDWEILTELVDAGTAVIVKASIANESGRVLATGYAEEERGSTNINKTSAVENAETSAIGRALAALGLAGTEYASADEVVNAINQQADKEQIEYMHLVMMHIDSVHAIKTALALDDLETAAEAWYEMDDRTKQNLWKAPTKGGCFTTKERETMKSTEFREAHYGADNER